MTQMRRDMSDLFESKSNIEKRNKLLTGLAFTIVVLGLLLPVLILTINNHYRAGHISPYLEQVFLQVKELGTIGDWIGGSATPLLNLGAFILLLVSLNYQKVETQQAREEFQLTMAELHESRALAREQGNLIKQQKFETTFFNLLNIFFVKEKDAKTSHDSETVVGMLSIEHEEFFTDLYLKTRAEYNNLDRQAANDENKRLKLLEIERENKKIYTALIR